MNIYEYAHVSLINLTIRLHARPRMNPYMSLTYTIKRTKGLQLAYLRVFYHFYLSNKGGTASAYLCKG